VTDRMDITDHHAWIIARREARRHLQDFWSWWSAELLGMLPGALRTALAPDGHMLFLEIREGVVTTSRGSWTAVEETGEQKYLVTQDQPVNLPAGIRETALLLPRERVLVKTVTFPLAAEENLREVLGFEMDRQTPFKADQVYYDYTNPVRDREKHTITVELVVAPRPALDESLAALARIGLHPDIVTTRRGDARPVAVNLLPARENRHRSLAARRVNLLLGALTAILLIGAIALPLLYKAYLIAGLEPMLESAGNQAADARHLREEVDHLTASSRFLVDRKHAIPMVLLTMNELTRVLPDDTWLERLEINGMEVQLEGISESAAALIPLLESSPYFGNARFRSPVTRAPSANQERFHISAEVVQEPDR